MKVDVRPLEVINPATETVVAAVPVRGAREMSDT